VLPLIFRVRCSYFCATLAATIIVLPTDTRQSRGVVEAQWVVQDVSISVPGLGIARVYPPPVPLGQAVSSVLECCADYNFRMLDPTRLLYRMGKRRLFVIPKPLILAEI
jgi:hypothetical protein